jgi:predicted transcriptional regulator
MSRPASQLQDHGAIAAIVHTDIPVVDSDDPLESALESLDRSGVALVIHRDELVGLLTTEQLATFAAFHAQRTSVPTPALVTS